MNKGKNTNAAGQRGSKRSSALRQHKRSVVIVCAVLILLTGTLAVNAVELYNTNKIYKQQEAELKAQIEKEKLRSKEVEEYEEYVKTDEYIKDGAEEKLGLVEPKAIIFKASE